MENKNPIQVSERIFSTIECMAESGPIGLIELSKQLGLNKTTVHRILTSLMQMNYVKQDALNLQYSLTYKLCGIANQILKQNNIIDLAKPFLRECAERSGETVHLVQIDGIHAIYIDKVESGQNSVRLVSMVGKSIPLYCSGVGKALLAEKTDEEVERIWKASPIKKLTPHTIVDFSHFQGILAQIRKEGYSMDNEENELGVRCIATALKDFKQTSKYAISISAPKDRMSDDRLPMLRDLILEITKKIESQL